MSTRKRLALCAAMFATFSRILAQAPPQFGQEIAPAYIAPWDISIGPDGTGLPPGSGTAIQGEAVYAAKCQTCHGEKVRAATTRSSAASARSRRASRR